MKLILIYLFACVASTISQSVFIATMFQEVVKANPGENVILSAFSVLPPLGQLALASVGESHDEILNAIVLPNDDVLKEQLSGVLKQIRSIKSIEVNVVGRIYIPIGETLNEQFAAASIDDLSDVKNIDFEKSDDAANEINSWVENNTNNNIKDLVHASSFDNKTAAVLVSAIYFKGKWTKQFPYFSSGEEKFYTSKDDVTQKRFMRQSNTFSYGESKELDAKILEMKYSGNQSSLVVFLPNKIDGISSLVDKLKDLSVANKAIESMKEDVPLNVLIPKFSIETTTNLRDALEKINVKKVFRPREARLEKMLKGDSDLHVSGAIQKATIEVNEEGTEAAAANAIQVVAAGLSVWRPSKYKEFKADHPFYFELRIGNIVVFNGVYVK